MKDLPLNPPQPFTEEECDRNCACYAGGNCPVDVKSLPMMEIEVGTIRGGLQNLLDTANNLLANVPASSGCATALRAFITDVQTEITFCDSHLSEELSACWDALYAVKCGQPGFEDRYNTFVAQLGNYSNDIKDVDNRLSTLRDRLKSINSVPCKPYVNVSAPM